MYFLGIARAFGTQDYPGLSSFSIIEDERRIVIKRLTNQDFHGLSFYQTFWKAEGRLSSSLWGCFLLVEFSRFFFSVFHSFHTIHLCFRHPPRLTEQQSYIKVPPTSVSVWVETRTQQLLLAQILYSGPVVVFYNNILLLCCAVEKTWHVWLYFHTTVHERGLLR